MVRKHTVYNVLLFGWGALVLGVAAAVFSGNAAPVLTLSMLPLSGPASLAVFAVPLVAGVSIILLFRRRAWRRAGQYADLSPDGWSLFGPPDLVGTRRGRQVTVRTIKRQTGSSGKGSSSTTYTVVEAALDEPSSDGIVVVVGDGTKELRLGEVATQTETAATGAFQTITDAPDRTRQLLTQRTRTALGAPDHVDTVFVGDASPVVVDALSESDGLMGHLVGAFETQVEEIIPGTTATVTTQTKGFLLDGEELDRQVAAVATVANEFEMTEPTDAAVSSG